MDVDAATKAGVWVASAPTTKTGNGESVAEHAVLLMLAVSRRLNEEGVGIHDRAQVPPKLELNRASSVKPSLTSTDAMAELMKSDALMAAFRQRMPIGRSATPEDIAGVIAFLASEDAVFVNGVILPVDGGFMLLTAGRISSRSWDKAEPKQDRRGQDKSTSALEETRVRMTFRFEFLGILLACFCKLFFFQFLRIVSSPRVASGAAPGSFTS